MITRRDLIASGVAMLSGAGASYAQDAMMNIDDMLPGDFTWHPERAPNGAVAVIASIPEQRVHVYRNGIRIAVSTCSTGRRGHETPTGVFTVLQKDADHRSSTYGGAPMPNMNRLTWDGIALHAGNLPGYPASHGCVRLPLEFSRLLFTVTHVGTPVILSGAHNDPWNLVHPGLVLNAFADDELATAVAGLDARSHPSDWGNEQPYPITTVLATAADRRLIVMEDGREVLEEEIGIEEDGPLGEHVLVVQERQDTGLVWMGVTHHSDPLHPLLPEDQVLNRMRLSDTVKRHLAERMHPGLTFVVSDLAATPDTRSGDDFVIMTGEGLQSPRPPMVRP
ncbi:L,D-transpeptidase family protein [Cognatishimia sp. F0-27]|uniref:L,D-transpeptidase family protein n=1 Tax=Cognatishimia sp. F0-27 TaxID=2816855 RepID=UPI001D0C7C07|nr:L,D-transpeptidase family protein [Cognatishimia sp. F0-27]MCC1493738.1 L,D-transpeptidase family protein [Cognatishimia sp. F0-27]